ncbi:DNA-directed RNA polymerase I subunit RPA34 [Aspergillus saccharolyticus JOP 1030-1]|uniref:DNA-directed RNA polymerase I subunit RPA34.5 n=1 Tax=Aspergillus saccharolyticus JOP 1030-1 TaxID=1450539 RepID=A0A318Z2E7_9EURO|nr:hypothetical protein BP01DRAFT_395756 [Aspergillus saccharolyticus JOP 1030-1]PYH40544.1 hypothetical protein BP01DRAFT_395756 [Aspergillus saccharolyticus JOP 1030-1]
MAPKSEEKITVSDDDVSMASSSAAESATSSEGESSSESGSDSDNESTTTLTKPSSRASAHAPQQYKPPPGFKSVKQQIAPNNNVSSLLSDLRGKQVYHITAPDYLPLSKVEEVSLAKIMQGKPVLKYKGVQYGIPAESITQSGVAGQALQLYDQKTKTYYSTAASNIPSYHIQELVDAPRDSEEDILAAVKEQVKPPRKQPKNLKMRFHPVGSGQLPPETIGSSSEESEGEAPTFKVPKSLEKEREERKRKHHPTEEEGAHVSETSRKKSKKHTSAQGVEQGEAGEDKKSKKSSSKSREEKKRKKADKAA